MERIKLTTGDWSVLSCLWDKNPQTVMQLVAALREKVGWAKSTTITTLHRMEAKGLIRCEQKGKTRTYIPTANQEQAVATETRCFLNRVYQGSVGLMMSSMAERQELTAGEISQLMEILEKAGENGK